MDADWAGGGFGFLRPALLLGFRHGAARRITMRPESPHQIAQGELLLAQPFGGQRIDLAQRVIGVEHGRPVALLGRALAERRGAPDQPFQRADPGALARGRRLHAVPMAGDHVAQHAQAHGEPVEALLAAQRMRQPDTDQQILAARLQHHRRQAGHIAPVHRERAVGLELADFGLELVEFGRVAGIAACGPALGHDRRADRDARIEEGGNGF